MELEIPRLQRREVNLIGHMMYVREDFADAIRFLAKGTVNTNGFVSQRFALNDFDAAFKFIDEHPNDVMKAVIDIGSR
jgi:L-iditol 2-dehydrogenase